jgi:hypothetical protein
LKKQYIPHIQFTICTTLEAMGGKAERKLLTDELAKQEFFGVDQAISAMVATKLLVVENSSVKLNSSTLSKLHNQSSNNKKLIDLKPLLKAAVKNCNANYKAVVDGLKPRMSASSVFTENLSRQDLEHYYKMIGGMTDVERLQFDNRLARLAGRSG